MGSGPPPELSPPPSDPKSAPPISIPDPLDTLHTKQIRFLLRLNRYNEMARHPKSGGMGDGGLAEGQAGLAAGAL